MEIDSFIQRDDIELYKLKGLQFCFASDWKNCPIERFQVACDLFNMKPDMANGYWDLSDEPGVYCYLDYNEIAYVGKSKNLRSRHMSHPHKRMMLGYAYVPEELISLREIQLITVLHPKNNHETKGLDIFLDFAGRSFCIE